MAMNPLLANLPGRIPARALAVPGEMLPGADLFASLLGVQLGEGAQLPVAAGARRKAPLAEAGDAQLLLYGNPQALVPAPLLPRNELAGAAGGEAGLPAATLSADAASGPDMLAMLEEMVQASKLPGGKKLPAAERQLLQFLPDGQLLASSAAPADAGRTAGVVPLAVTVPMDGSARWREEFATQVNGLIQLKAEGAKIQVNPAHLGPIEVSLKLGQDQAQLSFVTATPQARDAVEQGLSRLSAMLAQSGIQLTDAQVSYGGGRQQQEQQGRRHRALAEDETLSPLTVPVANGDERGLSIRA